MTHHFPRSPCGGALNTPSRTYRPSFGATPTALTTNRELPTPDWSTDPHPEIIFLGSTPRDMPELPQAVLIPYPLVVTNRSSADPYCRRYSSFPELIKILSQISPERKSIDHCRGKHFNSLIGQGTRTSTSHVTPLPRYSLRALSVRHPDRGRSVIRKPHSSIALGHFKADHENLLCYCQSL